ncbi:stress enhanced protein 1, chloroplastic-like isoform X1 [Papaver somniferum]|uniref:stress enhanced protein 1, chloroplastic-like isoform X1 n=1 Tax=Papaver somniferum TaxID=3469 RepID=UPI000E6F95DC|nr:stress enhanced protein 1, chloroplastic-like isoform X1 [Papaver somniferum]
MAQAQVVSPSLYYVNALKSTTQTRAAVTRIPLSSLASGAGSFTQGCSPLLVWKVSCQRKPELRSKSVSIRSEQSAKDDNGLAVWLGRFAMIGFAVALTVEISTGKGLLEVLRSFNFGLLTPLPTVALGVTALVGVLTAIFIFQSASSD